MPYLGAIVCSTVLLTFFIAHLSRKLLSKPQARYVNPFDILLLLASPSQDSRSLLWSRATPNQRLIRVFQLTNTFVSDDSDVHASFVARARSLLSTSTGRGWRHWQKVAISATHHCLSQQEMPFDVFVQAVTMVTVVSGLLNPNADVADISADDAIFCAQEITSLWRLSKTGAEVDSNRLQKLNQRLRLLIPDAEKFPNPLDFVVPAWETLWRVVAAIIASTHTFPETSILEDYHNNPTLEQFRRRDATHGFSAADIVTEILRLHPPTKRISRALIPSSIFSKFILSFFGKYLVATADVEQSQRLPGIWGPNADLFDPRRHAGSSLDSDSQLLAFGCGKLRCIAASWAPLAAGGIAAAISVELHREGYHVVPGNTIGGRDGWAGWKVTRVEAVSTHTMGLSPN
ncbi:hypothetical protein HGRIS_013805 [Hohenbuehelia grisea]|uniref:Cytochrome P450 n=1 Tax=Hohenbuehelia grisea TaxID=104357 RepID=A0ABR3IWI0_9AGAR